MNRNLPIESLRAICALIVFFSHALCFPNISIEKIFNSPLHLFFDGQIAVIIFITLSGFFYQSKRSLSNLKDYTHNVWRKIIRILIPYTIVILIGYVCCNLIYNLHYESNNFSKWGNSFWKEYVDFYELVRHLLVIIPHNTHLIDPPSWYVPVETRLFLLMPLFIWGYKYIKFLVFIPLIALMLIGLNSYMGVCAIGCLSKISYDYLNKKNIRINRGLTFFIRTLLLLISIFLLNIKNEFNITEDLSLFLQAIGAAILIPIIFTSKLKLFTNKVLVFIGSISYEFYLIHFIIMLSFRPLYIEPISFIVFVFVSSLLFSLGLKILTRIISNYLNRDRQCHESTSYSV